MQFIGSLEIFVLLLSFVLGTMIGSFLNVCIYRIPAGESIVSPSSHCPRCGQSIRWYQNVPLLSYLLLRGRCGTCGEPISLRYPAIEALTGVLFLFVAYHFGAVPETVVYFIFVALLVVITFIDLDHQLILDVISLPGILVGFLCSTFISPVGWLDSLLGVLAGGGLLFAVAFGYELLTRKEGMGGGDIKLLAMIGAFLGWQAILPVVFIASLLGTVIGLPVMLSKKSDVKMALPFGPFLSVAALIVLLYGHALLTWYLGFFPHN